MGKKIRYLLKKKKIWKVIKFRDKWKRTGILKKKERKWHINPWGWGFFEKEKRIEIERKVVGSGEWTGRRRSVGELPAKLGGRKKAVENVRTCEDYLTFKRFKCGWGGDTICPWRGPLLDAAYFDDVPTLPATIRPPPPPPPHHPPPLQHQKLKFTIISHFQP